MGLVLSNIFVFVPTNCILLIYHINTHIFYAISLQSLNSAYIFYVQTPLAGLLIKECPQKASQTFQGEGMVSFEFSTVLKHIRLNLHIIIGLL